MTDRVYTSDQNEDAVLGCINIDMIKLLKDEIVFLRGWLISRIKVKSKNNQSLDRTELTLSKSPEKMQRISAQQSKPVYWL